MGTGVWRGFTFVVLIMGVLLRPFVLPAAELQKVVISSTAGASVGLLTELAKQYRLDEQQGLSLEIRYFDPAKAEEAIFFKQVHVGPFAPISAARANLRGAPVRIFAPLLWLMVSVVTSVEAPVRGIEELKGKRLGMYHRITGTYTASAIIWKARGLDLEKEYRLIIGAPPVVMGLLEKREVEAAVLSEPFVTRMLVTRRFREAARLNDLWREATGQPMLMIGLAAHQEWLAANPKAAAGLVRMFRETIARVHRTPEVIDEFRRFLNIRSEPEAQLFKERLPVVFPAVWDDATVANARLLVQRAVELGQLERMPADEIFVQIR
ncbi:MAG: ABC transporter substrate-binding protein [Deltaproteobacteria bacterium]|nr:ABC transporter substrate-binding protein [Deltaproteobacteria bacterium]